MIDLSSGATESAHNDPQECPRVGVSAFSQSQISIACACTCEKRLIGICAQVKNKQFSFEMQEALFASAELLNIKASLNI